MKKQPKRPRGLKRKPQGGGSSGGYPKASRTVTCPDNMFCLSSNWTFMIAVAIGVIGTSIWNGVYNNNTTTTNNNNNSNPSVLVPEQLPLLQQFSSTQRESKESGYDMLRGDGLVPLARPNVSTNSDPKDTLLNPYSPPINVNMPHKYVQVGYLKSEQYSSQMFPLFAKPQHVARDKWYYYTIYDNIKLPVYNSSGRKCSSEYGCDRLYSGDNVTLENLSGTFVEEKMSQSGKATETTEMCLEDAVLFYEETLTTPELVALDIARRQLESSFDMSRSIGFVEFLQKNNITLK